MFIAILRVNHTLLTVEFDESETNEDAIEQISRYLKRNLGEKKDEYPEVVVDVRPPSAKYDTSFGTEVGQKLQEHGMGHLAPRFHKEAIHTLKIAQKLTNQDFKDLGIMKIGDQKAVLEIFKEEEEDTSKLPF